MIVEVSPLELNTGSVIVVKKSDRGVALKTMKVEKIDHMPRGCRGKVHVNERFCYDNIVKVDVLA